MPKFQKDSSQSRGKPWQARVRADNMTIFLGCFATREEAQEVEDEFNRQKADPRTVLSKCYCESKWVWIPKSWIKKFTKSCGAKGCVHPLVKARDERDMERAS